MTKIIIDKKEENYRNIINLLLQDKSIYCNNCFQSHPRKDVITPCCDNPFVGDNMDHVKALIRQNKEYKKTRLNKYGSDKSKTIRMALSIPPCIYYALFAYEMKKNEVSDKPRSFLSNDEDIIWFSKKFPQFVIPEVL